MRVVISAGGTGGHIYPALAIWNKIKEMEPDSEILYIGTTDRMESKIIPEKGIPYVGIEMKGLNRKNIFKNVKVFNCFRKGIKIARKEIKEFNPDIVLGIGGYITLPVIYAAHKEGYKTFIHEQNSIPGLSNKLMMKKVNRIGVSLPSSIKYFPKDKTIYTGNPRSEEVIKTKPVSKKSLGLKEDMPLVVIVMGSLGSMTINQKLKGVVRELRGKDYQVILITGKGYYEEFIKDLEIPSNVKIVPFLDNMLAVLQKTDLIVSRAGASTIAEITALGVPSILIPSPYVTHNHQYENAKSLEREKATYILEEKDFSERALTTVIDELMEDKEQLKAMSKNAKKLGITDSATKIYTALRKIIDNK